MVEIGPNLLQAIQAACGLGIGLAIMYFFYRIVKLRELGE
jgi:hypothetical protein